MRYFRKIMGDRVYLSPVNPDDYEIYTKWMNDPEVAGYLSMTMKYVSLLAEKKALDSMANEGYNFAVIRAENDELLGNITLRDINQIKRSATLGGMYIGEAENRSRGYGTEAICLMLGYGFNTLNLHNIMLNVHSDNLRAITCYTKIGFHEYGRRREVVFKDGKYHDQVHMDILEHEFRERYGK